MSYTPMSSGGAAVEIPSYYVVVNIQNVVNKNQATINIEGVNFDKPFKLYLYNTAFVNLLSPMLYISNGSSDVAYNVVEQTSVGQYTGTYWGNRVLCEFICYKDPGTSKYCALLTSTDYNDTNFLELYKHGFVSATDPLTIVLRSDTRYLLFTYEYNASTGAYRGHRAFHIYVAQSDLSTGKAKTPAGVTFAAGGTAGVALSYSTIDDGLTPTVTLKATAGFEVQYAMYEILNH